MFDDQAFGTKVRKPAPARLSHTVCKPSPALAARPHKRLSRSRGEPTMIESHRLSLEEAELGVDAALARAAELGVGSVACVCDAAGWPIVIKRPDNGKPTSVEIAINKAFTAACHRRPTHTYTNAQPGQEAFGIMN